MYLTNPAEAWVACPGILHRLVYSIHFSISKTLCGWDSSAILEWNCCLPPLPLCSEWGSSKRQRNLTESLVERSSTEVLLWWLHWKNYHGTNKIDRKRIKSITMSRFYSRNQAKGVSFCICEYFYCISLQFPVWCQRLVCNKVTTECFDAFKFDSCQLEFESFSSYLKKKMVKYDEMLIWAKIPDSKVHGAKHGAHLDPVGPRWAPCWPHEPCYQG